MNNITIKKLTQSFYFNNSHLKEALDIGTGNIKPRGYGIILVETMGLTFGVPLRSNMIPKYGFVVKKEANKYRGLDYRKAVLITDETDIGGTFNIPNEDFNKIIEKQNFIIKKFTKYVKRYVALHKQGKKPLNLDIYMYSTLQNYHKELGL